MIITLHYTHSPWVICQWSTVRKSCISHQPLLLVDAVGYRNLAQWVIVKLFPFSNSMYCHNYCVHHHHAFKTDIEVSLICD